MLTARSEAPPTPAASAWPSASYRRRAVRVGPELESREGRVPHPAPRPVGDAQERDGVGRVVDHLQVGDRVLDLGALVEARAADHLVGHALADEHVLQDTGLRVRPVEDRDLAAGVALLDPLRHLGGDEAGLGVLVLDLEHAHRVAVPELGPEVLLLALAVVRDHAVRGAQDRVRRAVVLLQRDRARAGEVALELEHVADVGAAEGVDGLVGVADGADVLVVGGEQLQQLVLRVVRVLVLVDEDVAERLAPLLGRVGEALEDLDREHEQVVEVDGVRAVQAALVELVDLGDGLVVERRDAGHVLVRADELVLRVRDLRVDAARDETLRVALELLQARLGQADLVGLVVDREVRAVAEPLCLAAEDPPAGGVEGEDPDRAGDAAEQALEPRAHLPRRLVRERDREDLVRLHAAGGDQVGDAVREDARLAGAGAGDDEERPFGLHDGLTLGVVQPFEVPIGADDGHAPMLAARLRGDGLGPEQRRAGHLGEAAAVQSKAERGSDGRSGGGVDRRDQAHGGGVRAGDAGHRQRSDRRSLVDPGVAGQHRGGVRQAGHDHVDEGDPEPGVDAERLQHEHDRDEANDPGPEQDAARLQEQARRRPGGGEEAVDRPRQVAPQPMVQRPGDGDRGQREDAAGGEPDPGPVREWEERRAARRRRP